MVSLYHLGAIIAHAQNSPLHDFIHNRFERHKMKIYDFPNRETSKTGIFMPCLVPYRANAMPVNFWVLLEPVRRNFA
jgi:hypothetical protein